MPKKGRQPAITDIAGLRRMLAKVDDDFARPSWTSRRTVDRA
jgi:hypothetical protein